MDNAKPAGSRPEFDTAEGISLAVSYLDNPSDVVCPRCGPNHIEIVAYLDAEALKRGRRVATSPEGSYAVVLFCRSCEQGAALSFRPAPPEEGRQAA